jgi:hypothetical protein
LPQPLKFFLSGLNNKAATAALSDKVINLMDEFVRDQNVGSLAHR